MANKSLHKLINQNKMSVAEEFLMELTTTIENENYTDKDTPAKTINPSSADCNRRMFFKLSGYEIDNEKDSYSSIGICESGTDRHLRIQNTIKSIDKYYHNCKWIDVGTYIALKGLDYLKILPNDNPNETKIEDTRDATHFLCDGLVLFNGEFYIFEFKTEIDRKFWDRDSIEPKHLTQTSYYANKLKVNKVIFVYENRNSCLKKCYLYEYSDSEILFVDETIKKLLEDVDNKNIPDKCNKCQTKLDTYCPYKEYCR